MTILNGKEYAAKWHAEAAEAAKELVRLHGVKPGLAVILVGDNPASVSYVTAKEKACVADGFASWLIRLPQDTAEETVLAEIERLNKDPLVHGILVQLPLPRHIDENRVIDAISPDKDVDGFTPANVGRMIIGQPCFIPCTPHGIVRLIADAGIETSGRHAVVIGRSNIVGKPIANLLARKAPGPNATVTICHTGTRDMAAYTRQADILVVATGRPNTVTADMVKPGAAVIDVGVNRIPDATKQKGYRLVGDVDYEGVSKVAGWITPVPGGVGPLTIAMLIQNTLEAARRTIA